MHGEKLYQLHTKTSFMVPTLMWIKTIRCLDHNDSKIINVSSPSKYKSKYKKEIKQR